MTYYLGGPFWWWNLASCLKIKLKDGCRDELQDGYVRIFVSAYPTEKLQSEVCARNAKRQFGIWFWHPKPPKRRSLQLAQFPALLGAAWSVHAQAAQQGLDLRLWGVVPTSSEVRPLPRVRKFGWCFGGASKQKAQGNKRLDCPSRADERLLRTEVKIRGTRDTGKVCAKKN